MWIPSKNNSQIEIKPFNPEQKIFIQFDGDIQNFEFNSCKKKAFVHADDKLYLSNDLKVCNILNNNLLSVTMAHWAYSPFHILYLNSCFDLFLLDIRAPPEEFLRNTDARIDHISNITNFIVLPNSENLKVACIRKHHDFTDFCIFVIYIKDQIVDYFDDSDPSFFKDDHDGKLLVLKSHAQIECQLNMENLFDVATCCNSKIYVATKNSAKIGAIYVFDEENNTFHLIQNNIENLKGFMSCNQTLFVISDTQVYTIKDDELTEYLTIENVIGISFTPHIILSHDKTFYYQDGVETIVDNQGQISSCEITEKIQKYQKLMNDSFFDYVNLIQFRGNKLQKRQEQIMNKFNVLKAMFNNINDISELKQQSNELLQRVKSLQILKESEIQTIMSQVKDLQNRFNDLQK
ncbi:hypothetical protein TRFO_09310 [Tritrichomonas foetus]|uniref:Uncharacterized protein n=1 Tax=Tritrichomonas foetus TaxID=1144522 RepID=A0A1J4JEJ4_9EUKA|nr:hypothetical protein TRFO_09310 [Tritrichomonas foetus]|eukprot:OHS97614.1 hypothetical protein TRFO_09310 [Tritrichomonas foetus]